MRRVVITGLGALTPIGETTEDFWKNIQAGKSGAAPITKFDTEKFRCRFACELKDFNPKDHFHVKELRKYDPFTQYGIFTADQAIEDAGIDFKELNRNRIGVIWDLEMVE